MAAVLSWIMDSSDYAERSPLFPNPLVCLRDMTQTFAYEVRATAGAGSRPLIILSLANETSLCLNVRCFSEHVCAYVLVHELARRDLALRTYTDRISRSCRLWTGSRGMGWRRG